MERVKIVLKSGKDQSLQRFHPWIFSGAIKKIYGNPAEGDFVDVYSNKDDFLAVGHYQIGSIAVRVLSFENIEPNIEFFRDKILKAWNLRKIIGLADNPENSIYRLINAEGDELPGMIADFYNGNIVLQMHSIGMWKLRNQITEIFKSIYGETLHSVYDKSESTLPFKANLNAKNSSLFGNSTSIEAKENGLKFKIDWETGQKTGFFIDQRQNRKLVAKFSSRKNVLNLFGYTGAFSVYSLQGGANKVVTVDSSESSIKIAHENIKINFQNAEHQEICADVFDYFTETKGKFDLVILDPPAFAKHNDVLHNALQGYKKLNAKAIENIKENGILFTFSCSQVVSRDAFRKAVFSGAALTGRKVKILSQLSQPEDHPVNIYHPEGEYLKGLILYVE